MLCREKSQTFTFCYPTIKITSYKLGLFSVYRHTIFQPSANLHSAQAPSNRLAPTLWNSYKMFFQMVTPSVLNSLKMNIRTPCRDLPLANPAPSTHLNNSNRCKCHKSHRFSTATTASPTTFGVRTTPPLPHVPLIAHWTQYPASGTLDCQCRRHRRRQMFIATTAESSR